MRNHYSTFQDRVFGFTINWLPALLIIAGCFIFGFMTSCTSCSKSGRLHQERLQQTNKQNEPQVIDLRYTECRNVFYEYNVYNNCYTGTQDTVAVDTIWMQIPCTTRVNKAPIIPVHEITVRDLRADVRLRFEACIGDHPSDAVCDSCWEVIVTPIYGK